MDKIRDGKGSQHDPQDHRGAGGLLHTRAIAASGSRRTPAARTLERFRPPTSGGSARPPASPPSTSTARSRARAHDRATILAHTWGRVVSERCLLQARRCGSPFTRPDRAAGGARRGRHIRTCATTRVRRTAACKLCTVKINGWHATSCTSRRRPAPSAERDCRAQRRAAHDGPAAVRRGQPLLSSCEESGHCKLQAVAYDLGMTSPRFDHFFRTGRGRLAPGAAARLQPLRLCELCVRASRGRWQAGVRARRPRHGQAPRGELVSGLLRDSDIAVTDKAAEVCPWA